MTPVLKAQRHAAHSEPSRLRRIAVLFTVGSPLAVVWVVALRVVYALKGESWRALAHVRDKVLKVSPAVTDFDAARSVSWVIGILRVVAAPAHRSPNGIVFRCRLMCRRAMSASAFSLPASTACCIAAHKIAASDNRVEAAYAQAMPHHERRTSAFSGCERREPTEHATSQVQCAWMKFHLWSMCASMMRLTSSAIEMPRRLASRFRNALCGSVNEIICFVIYSSLNGPDGSALRLMVWFPRPLDICIAKSHQTGPENGPQRSRTGLSPLHTRSSFFAWANVAAPSIVMEQSDPPRSFVSVHRVFSRVTDAIRTALFFMVQSIPQGIHHGA